MASWAAADVAAAEGGAMAADARAQLLAEADEDEVMPEGMADELAEVFGQ